jgi:membrane-bound lytic murein transglycosylase D
MRFFCSSLILICLTFNAFASEYELPDEIIFAGVKVPLEKFDVKDRLTRTFNTFTLDRRGYMQNIINKQHYYMPYAKEILVQYGIHEDLAYIMPVESEFDPRAYSSAKASGLWQMMPATAKMYGLRVDDYADDRNMPERATKAAAEHLRMLAKVTKNDPFLMVASYNNGDTNVRNTIKAQKAGDFWEARSNHETEFYVEKVIIYKLLMSDPEKYGFTLPEDPFKPEYELCTVSMGSDNLYFTEVCEILGITYRELYKANPHLKFGTYKSASYMSKYTAQEIMVPKGSSEKLLSELKKRNYLAGSPDSPIISSEVTAEGAKEDIYEIRYNDNIESIAFKYGVDWKKIAELNDLKIVTLSSGVETAELNRGQKLRIIR